MKASDIPHEVRALMDGQAAAPETLDAFLRRKDEGFQNALLGVQKAQMWREVHITVSDLVDQNNRPLTVAELQSLIDKNEQVAAIKHLEGEQGLGLIERTLLEASMLAGIQRREVLTHFMDLDTGLRISINGMSPTTANLDEISGFHRVQLLRNGLTHGEVFTPQEIGLFGHMDNFVQARIVNPAGRVLTITLKPGMAFTPADAKDVNERFAALENTFAATGQRLAVAVRKNASMKVNVTPAGIVQPHRRVTSRRFMKPTATA